MSVVEEEARLSAAVAMSVLATGVGLHRTARTTSGTSKMTLTSTSQTCRPSVFDFPPRSTVLRFPVSLTKRRLASDGSDLTLSPGSVSPHSSGYASKHSELSDLDSPFPDRPSATLPPKKRRVAQQKSADKMPVFRKKRLLNDWSHSEAVSPRAPQCECDEIAESNCKTILDPVPMKSKNNEGAKRRKYSTSSECHAIEPVPQALMPPDIVISPADSSSKVEADCASQPSPLCANQPSPPYVSQPSPKCSSHPSSPYVSQPSSPYVSQPSSPCVSQPSPKCLSQPSSPYMNQSSPQCASQLSPRCASQPSPPCTSQPSPVTSPAASMQPLSIIVGNYTPHLIEHPGGALHQVTSSGEKLNHAVDTSSEKTMHQTGVASCEGSANLTISPMGSLTSSYSSSQFMHGLLAGPAGPVPCLLVPTSAGLQPVRPVLHGQQIIHVPIMSGLVAPLSPSGYELHQPPVHSPGGRSVQQSRLASPLENVSESVDSKDSSVKQESRRNHQKLASKTEMIKSEVSRSPSVSPDGSKTPKPATNVSVICPPSSSPGVIKINKLKAEPSGAGLSCTNNCDLRKSRKASPVSSPLGSTKPSSPSPPGGSSMQPPPGVMVAMPINPHQNIRLLSECQMAVRPDDEGDLPLHIAAVQGHLGVIQKVIPLMQMAGVSIDSVNRLQQTPLHLSVITKKPDVAAFLLHHGADPNLLNRHGNGSLHLAVHHDSLECLRVILRGPKKANLQIKNFEGLSPLHSAVLHKKRSLVEELIEAGADVDLVEGKSGRTSLHLATETNQPDLVQLLLTRGAGVNLQSYSGSTALHLASGRGLQDIVALLLNSGADSTLRNVYMDTAMTNGCSAQGSPKANRRLGGKGRPLKPIVISPLSEDSSEAMSPIDLRQKLQKKIKNNCS